MTTRAKISAANNLYALIIMFHNIFSHEGSLIGLALFYRNLCDLSLRFIARMSLLIYNSYVYEVEQSTLLSSIKMSSELSPMEKPAGGLGGLHPTNVIL